MRTTVRIEDHLLQDLRRQAERERVSLTKMLNRVLRVGLAALDQQKPNRGRYREKTFSMGQAKVDLDRALALAAALEDEEVREELARRK